MTQQDGAHQAVEVAAGHQTVHHVRFLLGAAAGPSGDPVPHRRRSPRHEGPGCARPRRVPRQPRAGIGGVGPPGRNSSPTAPRSRARRAGRRAPEVEGPRPRRAAAGVVGELHVPDEMRHPRRPPPAGRARPSRRGRRRRAPARRGARPARTNAAAAAGVGSERPVTSTAFRCSTTMRHALRRDRVRGLADRLRARPRAGPPPGGPASNRPTSRLTRSPPAAATTPAAATADDDVARAIRQVAEPPLARRQVAPVGVHHHGAHPGRAHRPRPAPRLGGRRPPRLDHRRSRRRGRRRGGRAARAPGRGCRGAPRARSRAEPPAPRGDLPPRRQGVGAQARHLLAAAGRPRGERRAGGGGVLQERPGRRGRRRGRGTGRATRARTSAGRPGRRSPAGPRPSTAAPGRRTSPRRWRRRPPPPPPACAGTRAAPRTGSGSR